MRKSALTLGCSKFAVIAAVIVCGIGLAVPASVRAQDLSDDDQYYASVYGDDYPFDGYDFPFVENRSSLYSDRHPFFHDGFHSGFHEGFQGGSHGGGFHGGGGHGR